MQDHATDDGVFIRSMASRGQLGGLSAAVPQALRVLDAAGCDVVLVETVGVGQAEVEIASLADTTLLRARAGDGRRDPGGQGRDHRDRRRVRRQQGRSRRRRPGGARPALHAVARWPAQRHRRVAAADREDVGGAQRGHRRRRRRDRRSTATGWSEHGELERRRQARAATEIEAIALGEVRQRFAAVHGSSALDAAAARVAAAPPTRTPRPRSSSPRSVRDHLVDLVRNRPDRRDHVSWGATAPARATAPGRRARGAPSPPAPR